MSIADAAVACMKCGFCKSVCPVHLISEGCERTSPRARVRLAKAVANGEIELTPAVAEEISHCINCKACVAECPSGVKVDRIVMEMRAALVTRDGLSTAKKIVFRDLLPKPARLAASARLLGGMSKIAGLSPLRSVFPLIGLPRDKRLPPLGGKPFRSMVPEISEPIGRPRMTVAFFPGCSGDLVYPRIAMSAWRALRKLGCRVIVPRDFVCCGTPVLNSGDFDGARVLAETNVRILSGLHVDAVVTACGSCGLTIGREWKEMLGVAVPDELASKVRDVSSLILQLMDSPMSADTALKITYHDSCHLRRGMGVFTEPRELLKSVEGVELVEMENADRCCGGGGAFSIYHPELSRQVGSAKADSIAATGAAAVVTGCPACVMQLEECLGIAGSDVEVLHTIELLDRSLDDSPQI